MDEYAEVPSITDDEKKMLKQLLTEDNHDLSEFGHGRRLFLKQMLAAGGALLAFQLLGEQTVLAGIAEPAVYDVPVKEIENPVTVNFKVNGTDNTIQVDSRMTLLDTLREKLQLTGSKKGCDHGQCGACTVIVNDRRVLSCLTLAASCEGRSVQTIEGFAKNGSLHPLQESFLKHDGFQCGFCTPGQICSGIALAKEARNGDASYVTANIRSTNKNLQLPDEEIRERMSGNICRCGAYANIVAAIKEVINGKAIPQEWIMLQEKVIEKI